MTTEPEKQGETDDDGPEGDVDWKSRFDAKSKVVKDLEKKYADAAKAADANAAAAKRLAELEQSDKSEVQKAQDAAKAAEDRAAAAELNLARVNVALRKNLTEGQAKRLQGTTEEELETDADELLALLKPAEREDEPETGLPRRPQERLRPGARPSSEPQMTAKDIVDKAAAISTI